MANIVFNVAGKVFLNFSPISAHLIREKSNTVPVTLNYTNGTGQTMTAGQVLYTSGISGQLGFLEVVVNSTTTLTGTGSVPLTVNSKPTATQANQNVPFDFDQSTITLNLTYNSIPQNTDINLTTANRTEYVFKVTDFTNHFSDFDGDSLAEVMAMGTMTGYLYDVNGTNNFLPYAPGTWIPINNVVRLKFKPADQNAAYSQSNPWFAKDSQGNISE